MNSGDVFILDATEGVFVWVGREANAWERRQACEVAQEMRQRAGGNREKMGTGPFTEVTIIEEATPRADPPAFALHLPVETDQLGGQSRGVQAAEVEPDADVKGLPVSLFQLSLDRAKRFACSARPVHPPSAILRRCVFLSEDTRAQLPPLS